MEARRRAVFVVIVSATLLSSRPVFAQLSQQGAKFVGTAAIGIASQGSSESLSADGNTAIVGGDGDNRLTGAAWVLKKSAPVWTSQGPKPVGSGALPAVQAANTVLRYVAPATSRSMRVTLRRERERLVVIDDDSGRVVASSAGGRTRRVVIRGGGGVHDDTLTVDLSQQIELPEGIDYDGGSGGWDSLVVTGGHLARQTLTQRSKGEGVMTCDALTIRYANLEPITDTASASLYTITGTFGNDDFSVDDGPIIAGQQTTTVSAATIEAVTFANKTAVEIDGRAGTDTLVLNNPSPAAGLTTLVLNGMTTVTQTAPLVVPNFATIANVSSGASVMLTNASNVVSTVASFIIGGSFTFNSSAPLTVGKVTGNSTTTGIFSAADPVTVSSDGDLTIDQSVTAFTAVVTLTSRGGSITQTANTQSIGASGLALSASSGLGTAVLPLSTNVHAIEGQTSTGGAFVVTPGDMVIGGVTGALSGLQVTTSGDMQLLGSSSVRVLTDGDTIRGAGNIFVEAVLGSVITGGQSSLPAISGLGGGTVSIQANQDILLGDSTGIGSIRSANGAIQLHAIRNITVNANATVSVAGGSGRIDATAFAGIQMLTAPGTLAGAPAFSTAGGGVTLVTGATVTADSTGADAVNSAGGTITITANQIAMNKAINAGAGTALLSATGFTGPGPVAGSTAISFTDTASIAGTWNVTGTSVQLNGSAAVNVLTPAALLTITGGTVGDVFNVTPAPSGGALISIAGNLPIPFAFPGDALNVNLSGTTGATQLVTATPSGYQGSFTFTNRQSVNFSQIESGIELPGIAKAFGLSSMPLNATTSLTVTLQNASGAALAAVSFNDALPAGLVVAATPNVTNSCGGTVAALAGSGIVSLSNGTVPANGICNVSVSVTGTTFGPKDNTVFTGVGTVNFATVIVLAPPSILKAFNPALISTGSSAQLTFTITNPSANLTALTGVGFNDVLPAGITVGSSTSSICGGTLTTGSPGNITLSGASISANSQCQFTISVTGSAAGLYTNITGNVSSANGGTGDSATAFLTVSSADLAITKTTSSPPPYATGLPITYALTVHNAGPSTATDVVVTDTIPAGTTFVSAVASQGGCAGAPTMTCSLGAMLSGDLATITLVVTLPDTLGPLSNTAAVSSSITDTNQGNNIATSTVTVVSASAIPTLSAQVLLLLTLAFIGLGLMRLRR